MKFIQILITVTIFLGSTNKGDCFDILDPLHNLKEDIKILYNLISFAHNQDIQKIYDVCNITFRPLSFECCYTTGCIALHLNYTNQTVSTYFFGFQWVKNFRDMLFTVKPNDEFCFLNETICVQIALKNKEKWCISVNILHLTVFDELCIRLPKKMLGSSDKYHFLNLLSSR